MKKLLTLAATAAIITTSHAQEPIELFNPQQGAICSAWIVKTNEKTEGKPIAYFPDKGDAFAAANVSAHDKSLNWANKDIVICWKGYVNITTAGSYTITAQSKSTFSVSHLAGCLIKINGNEIISYGKGDASDTQKPGDAQLMAGFNEVEIWMRAPSYGNHFLDITYQKDGSFTKSSITPAKMRYEQPED